MGKSAAQKDRESNEKIQELNRESNEKINTQNITSQESINEKNLAFQRENLEYQKALQQQIFQREDSAYQRTVNDMRSAGLSPLTMNGTNSAGEAIATSALDAGTAPRAQPYAMQGLYNHYEEFMGMLNTINQAVGTLDNLAKLPNELQQGHANLISTRLGNEFSKRTMENRVESDSLDLIKKWYDKLDYDRKHAYNAYFGINDSMTPEERYMAIYSRAFNLGEYIDSKGHLKLYNDFGNGIRQSAYNNEQKYYANELNYARGFLAKSASQEIIKQILEMKNALISPKKKR